jgi:hypothetical protein
VPLFDYLKPAGAYDEGGVIRAVAHFEQTARKIKISPGSS